MPSEHTPENTDINDSDTEDQQKSRIDRLVQSLRQIPERLSSTETCKHEDYEGTVNYDENSIWHLKETYLKGEPYWTETDAAFGKTRERVKEFRCLGCGEERTVTTGEVLEYKWKDDMTTEEISDLRDEADSGSYYNGWLWWEDNVWDGDAKEVATRLDWIRDVGYTKWKKGGFKD